MTKIYAQTLKELETLTPGELLKMYDVILSLKHNQHPQKIKSISSAYLDVREALKGCNGSLAKDIIAERGDRI